MKMKNLNEMLDNIVQRIDDESEAQGVQFSYMVWVVDATDGRGDLRNNGDVDALVAMSVMAQHKLCHELEESGCIRKVEAEVLSIDEVHAATLEEERGIRELPTPAEEPGCTCGHPISAHVMEPIDGLSVCQLCPYDDCKDFSTPPAEEPEKSWPSRDANGLTDQQKHPVIEEAESAGCGYIACLDPKCNGHHETPKEE